tara:strand:+ start:40 stop:282 length:243 start_codon:yes stop_codon:yes gene_type:complete
MTKYNELVDHLVSTMKTNSREQSNNNSDLSSYIKEIETQANKPLEEQLNDLKIAGAKLLQSIDNISAILNNNDEKERNTS